MGNWRKITLSRHYLPESKWVMNEGRLFFKILSHSNEKGYFFMCTNVRKIEFAIMS